MKKFLIFLVVGVLAIGIGTSIKVRANPLQDYEVIERINFEDDNWEFTSLPFGPNDNWQEYGLRFFIIDSNDNIHSGVCYISTFSSIETENEWTRFYGLIYIDPLSQYIISMMIADINTGMQMYGFQVFEGIYGWEQCESSWVELIRVLPNIDSEYNIGYQTGYAEGISQNFSSFGSFLTNSVGGFLNFEIFPGFSLMNILWAMLGILLFVIILKVFAGG